MATDVVIELDNKPGELARVTAGISDAGVNLAAATCVGNGEKAELHILVPHAEPVRRALAITQTAITAEREVVVVEVHEDRPGTLAALARKVAEAGINIDLLYVATKSRVVFGSPDLEGLRAVLEGVTV